MNKKDILKQKLYVIVDTDYIDCTRVVECVENIIDAGCSLIQYRDKKSSQYEVLKSCLKIKEALPKNVVFVINDYVELVKDVGADGVHLGQEDTTTDLAREILGEDKIIGLSTHSYMQALEACDKPVDYIGFGPIFKTNTKPQAIPIGTDDLERVKKAISIPIFAIGGINEKSIEDVLRAGAERVAIVSAILTSSDIRKTTINFINKIKNYKKG